MLGLREHNTVKSQIHGFYDYRNYLARERFGTLHGNKACACFETFLLQHFQCSAGGGEEFSKKEKILAEQFSFIIKFRQKA